MKKKKNRTCNSNNNTEEKVKKAFFIFPEKNKYKKTRSREAEKEAYICHGSKFRRMPNHNLDTSR